MVAEELESSEISGICIEVGDYRVIRMDTYNIVVQHKKYKKVSTEFYWVTDGYYSTERNALMSLYRKVQHGKFKSELKDVLVTVLDTEKAILEAIKGLKM